MSEKEKLINFIKSDKFLRTKMDKMCYAIGYATSDEKMTKAEILEVLQRIIYDEI